MPAEIARGDRPRLSDPRLGTPKDVFLLVVWGDGAEAGAPDVDKKPQKTFKIFTHSIMCKFVLQLVYTSCGGGGSARSYTYLSAKTQRTLSGGQEYTT